MAIVPMRKITLIGATSLQTEAVAALQDLGCVHLVGLDVAHAESPTNPKAIETREALRYLEDCPQKLRPSRRAEGQVPEDVVDAVISIRDRSRDLQDEREELIDLIRREVPWGEFRPPPPEALNGIRLWFYELPSYRIDEFQGCPHAWAEVARDDRNAYVVVLAESEPQGVPASRVDLDPRPLPELRERLSVVEDELEELHYHRVGLTRWRRLLAADVAAADDAAALEAALRTRRDAGPVFVLEGWIPRERTADLEQYAVRNGLAAWMVEPSPDDLPPTLLRNPELLAGGEQTVTFYMTPGYHSWDPSLVVFASFALFFGMIVGDAGYGLMLGGLLGWQWRRLGGSVGGRRFRNLMLALVASTIGFGVLTGSYFGWTPPPSSPLGAARVLDVNDYDLMMACSIVMGVVHLVLANLVTAWRRLGSPTALAPLGWVAVLLGGLAIYATGDAEASSAASAAGEGAWYAVWGGLGTVFLFSSGRPLRPLSPKNLGGRVLDGLLGLTRISNAFGDVLSYLRLFALALASSQLAATFNRLAFGADEGDAGSGLLLMLLILLVGHGLNFALAVLSGVVHGLRLNCIEFFNWSLNEEGYPFRPFARKAGTT